MKIGKLSESVLKRSVLRQLKTHNENIISGAGVGHDCAIFSCLEQEKLATCVQEGIINIIGEEAELGPESSCTLSISQLIQKCINNLAVSGAQPVAVMITLLLPGAIEEPQIKSLMTEAEKICHSYSIEIAGGQTRVTAAVKECVAVVTGYGKMVGTHDFLASCAKPGQEIVISKWIGLEGTSLLTKQYRESLLGRYPAYLVEEAEGFDRYLSVVPEALAAVKSGVCAMHDASEGGIFTALWELAESAGLGLTIDLKKLPLRQETVEVCEHCNRNPYELKSGGCLIMTAEDGNSLVTALEAEGIPAIVVGKLTDSNDRIIRNEDEVRFMDRPRTDEIYKTGQ